MEEFTNKESYFYYTDIISKTDLIRINLKDIKRIKLIDEFIFKIYFGEREEPFTIVWYYDNVIKINNTVFTFNEYNSTRSIVKKIIEILYNN